MENLDLIQRLGVAIAIGAVVGAERHWRERDEPGGRRVAGVRTFTLIGMFGGVSGIIARATPETPVAGGLVIASFFLAMSAAVALFQYRESLAAGTFSVTSTIAAMLTFALGAVAILGDVGMASAGGVSLAAILASREILHRFMQKLTWAELRSAIVLLGMTFVILPIIPEKPVGPFGGVSPAETWLLVIMLAAISYCGYVAVKLLGAARGEVAAGAIGGLISSTAATLTNARRSKAAAGAASTARPLAAGALAACAVSYIRTAVLVAVLAAPLVRAVAPPLLAAAGVMIACVWLLARGAHRDYAGQAAKNPFDLPSVLKMTLVLVTIAFLARGAAAAFGGAGVMAVAFLSGLADVDAAVVTVAGMMGAVSDQVAQMAIGAAVISNTLAKASYAIAFGRGAFSLPFALASALALAFGLGAAWLIQLV